MAVFDPGGQWNPTSNWWDDPNWWNYLYGGGQGSAYEPDNQYPQSFDYYNQYNDPGLYDPNDPGFYGPGGPGGGYDPGDPGAPGSNEPGGPGMPGGIGVPSPSSTPWEPPPGWGNWFNPGFATGVPIPETPFTTAGPNEMSEQDRLAARAWGQGMDQSLRDSTNRYQNLEGSFLDWGLFGPGGYKNILAGEGGFNPAEQSNLLQRQMLEGGMATPEQLGDVFYTDQEGADIWGQPYEAKDLAAGEVEALRKNALNEEQWLRLSPEFKDKFQFGDRDIQDIADRAARTVQLRSQAEQEALGRSARAAGNTTPLALASAQNRRALTGDIGAADAMTDARIRGRELALQTQRTREAMRLGSEQDVASRAARLGEWTTPMLADLARYGEAEQSRRATELANQRTGAQRYGIGTRWGQAYPASQALASRWGSIYGQRKGEEEEGRRYLSGQQARAQEGAQTSQQQRIGAGQVQFGNIGTATRTRAGIPGFWDKFVGAIGGALGG